ncbi:MAG: hypothetical protein MJ104_03285 [Lachnospiraceae bacterium]|nr:hypothetical protein [Lachnospiraceae bacterium]
MNKIKIYNKITAILFVVLAIFLSGCSQQSDNYESKPVYGDAKSIMIKETGGEDGRNLVWQIKEEDGKYFFSVDNLKYDRHILQEITEEEYKSVTCIDYEEYFENYLRDNTLIIMDDVYHHTIIEFTNNITYEGDDYYMTKIINMMYDIACKYDTCDFTDFFY